MIYFDRINDVYRFKARLIREGECLIYLGRLNTDGYGCFDVRHGMVFAHRFAYAVEHQCDPGEMLICHTCDTPACCEPQHLFMGTSQDNVRDSVAKGRHSSVTLFGEARPNSVLTEPEILNIRKMRRMGRTLNQIAGIFHVHLATIHQIVTYKTWRHLP